MAELRLIAAPGLVDGRYLAGADITMKPGSHTYWKQPGEAGVPPVFAFNGSQNVAVAQVLFPTPTRLDEGGIEAFGYRDKVVFPVAVTPKDRAQPAILKVDMTYAVCNKICVPAHSMATLTLAPAGDGLDGALAREARAAVPSALTPTERADLTVKPEAGAAKPTWTIAWSGAAPLEDVFADAPEGFYFDTKKIGPNRFNLVAAQIVGTSKTTTVPVSLTLALKDGGRVAMETLDVPQAAR